MYEGVAKNIMTVGAVDDAVSGGVRDLYSAAMSLMSSWGPANDGRIKPDIVANGVELISAHNASDSAYSADSGTSMACPNASGSAILLAEYWADLFPGQAMRASTLNLDLPCCSIVYSSATVLGMRVALCITTSATPPI